MKCPSDDSRAWRFLEIGRSCGGQLMIQLGIVVFSRDELDIPLIVTSEGAQASTLDKDSKPPKSALICEKWINVICSQAMAPWWQPSDRLSCQLIVVAEDDHSSQADRCLTRGTTYDGHYHIKGRDHFLDFQVTCRHRRTQRYKRCSGKFPYNAERLGEVRRCSIKDPSLELVQWV